MRREFIVLVLAVFMTQGMVRGLAIQVDLVSDATEKMVRSCGWFNKSA